MSDDESDSLRKFVQQCREEDPDFGKVSNAKPHEEFAFDVVGSPSVSAVASRELHDASTLYQGVNDFGVAVLAVPIGVTSARMWFPFTNYGFVFKSGAGVLSVGTFIWYVARHIQRVAEHPLDFEIEENDIKDYLLGLRFYRFYYSQDAKYWTPAFEPD